MKYDYINEGIELQKQKKFNEAEERYKNALYLIDDERILTESKESYKELIEIFIYLGRLYQDIAHNINEGNKNIRQTRQGEYYIKASILYNAALVIDQERGIRKKEDILSLRNELEKTFLQTSLSANDNTIDNHDYQKILNSIRECTNEKLIQIDKISTNNENEILKRARMVREISLEITDKLKSLLYKMIKDYEKSLGNAPCKYSVICFGSLATETATPYSDIEFGILLEEKKDSEDNKQYFRNLTNSLYLKIINLGETVIPFDMFGRSFDNILKRGFSFDLGGKTPLGRKYNDGKSYELIKTPTEMVKYISEEHFASTDKLLPLELLNCSKLSKEEINEEGNLYKNYIKSVRDFLSTTYIEGKPLHEFRALGVLSQGFKHANGFMKSNLEEFQPLFSDNPGKLYNVKQEIYRLPDRLICGLGLFYNLESISTWQKVEELGPNNKKMRTKNSIKAKGIINNQAKKNLKIIIAIASELRLRTYMHNKGQNESFSIFQDFSKDIDISFQEIFCLSSKDKGEGGCLFRFYYTALPLHTAINEFCQSQKSNNPSADFFKNMNLFDDNELNKGIIHERLLQYKEAIKYYTHQLLFNENIKQNKRLVSTFHKRLGHLYFMLGNYTVSLDNFDKALKEIPSEDIQSLEYEHLRYYRNKTDYQIVNNYTEAIISCQQFLSSYEQIEGKDLYYFSIIIELGFIYYEHGEYNRALKLYQEALQGQTNILGNENSLEHSFSFEHIGMVYEKKADYDQAVSYYNRSLNIRKKIFGGVNPLCASNIDKLSGIYLEKGEYKESISYQTHALKIIKQIYGEDHLMFGAYLNNLGNVYMENGQYDEAFNSYNKAKDIAEKVYGKTHIKYAQCIFNIGNFYGRKGKKCKSEGDYIKAISYFEKTLKIEEKILTKEHIEYALTLGSLGIVYKNRSAIQSDQKLKRQFQQKAEDYFEKAINIEQKVFGKNHPLHADMLTHKSSIESIKTNYQTCLEYYVRVLQIREKLLGEIHPKCADAHYNIGITYYKMKNYDQAAIHLKKVLKIEREKIGENHPNYIESLELLAQIYKMKKDNFRFLKCCKKIVELKNLPEEKKLFDIFEKITRITSNFDNNDNLGIIKGVEKDYKEIIKHKDTIEKEERELKDYFDKMSLEELEKIGVEQYFEFIRFLVKFHDINNKDEYKNIEGHLHKIIGLENKEVKLSEFFDVKIPKNLLNVINNLNFKIHSLAYYGLAKIHLMHNNQTKAAMAFKALKAIANQDPGNFSHSLLTEALEKLEETKMLINKEKEAQNIRNSFKHFRENLDSENSMKSQNKNIKIN